MSSSAAEKNASIIIFGPTGHVGSAAARALKEQDVKAFLAMRDPAKAIPGLSLEEEKEAGFERVYADLTKPDTVHAAVTKTGAKRALIYLIFGTPDHMKSTIVTLKSAGIDFVVFLSSYTVPDNLNMESISPSNFIAWGHGQVEIHLGQVFGSDGHWESLRRHRRQGTSGGNAGRDSNVIRLCGPEIMSQAAAADAIGKVIGKDIKLTRLDEQGGVDFFTKTARLPEPAARQLIMMLKKRAEDGKSDGGYFESPRYGEAVANIQKYGGRQPTGFHQWVEENKAEFGA